MHNRIIVNLRVQKSIVDSRSGNVLSKQSTLETKLINHSLEGYINEEEI